MIRAEILLFSVFAGVRREIEPERIIELVYLAFEHACEGVDAFRDCGLDPNALDDESQEARVASTLRYAEELRAELTDDDMATLAVARISTLR